MDPESYALRGTGKKYGPEEHLYNFASGIAQSAQLLAMSKVARLFSCAGEKSQSSNLSEYI